MDKNYVVTKSNFFIMNSNYELSLEEQKIILTLASMVQPCDKEFKPYFFKISDFVKLLGVKNKTQYSDVPRLTRELMRKVFEIKDENKVIQVAWLSSAEYVKGTGIVELQFSPKLKPYMLQLNKLYTTYKLVNILQMKSKYSPRIYEILKCNLFKSSIEITLEDLRKLLKIEHIYPRFNDFKRKIILQTQKELNKLTDINFEFEEIKTGRKVTSLKFFIQSQNSNDNSTIQIPKLIQNKEFKNNEIEVIADIKKDEIEIEIEIDEEIKKSPEVEEKEETDEIKFLKNLCDNKLNNIDCARILAVAEGNLDRIKDAYNIAMQQSQVNNLCGFLISCLKNNYSNPIAITNLNYNNSKTDSFNDYEQRQYDFNDLERKLLGWDNEDDEQLDPKQTLENFLEKLKKEGLNGAIFHYYPINFTGKNGEIQASLNGTLMYFRYKIDGNIVSLICKDSGEIIANKKF